MSYPAFSSRLPKSCFWHLFDSSVSSFNSFISRKPTTDKNPKTAGLASCIDSLEAGTDKGQERQKGEDGFIMLETGGRSQPSASGY